MNQWIDVAKQFPPIRKILSEPCQIDGQEVPHLYRSGEVICWDGKRVSGGIVEWFHGQKPLNGVTHWMPLPDAPEVDA